MGSPKKTLQYRYDARGNRRALIDHDNGRFTYSYDSVGRMTQLLNPQGQPTSFSYDAGGRRTLKQLSNGTRTSFSYDAASNLTKLFNLKTDGTVLSSFDYAYDKVGNRTRVLEAGGSRVTWSYDHTYQLTGEHRTGTTPYRDTYTYDAAGNRLLKNHDGARTTYAYDNANQLRYSQEVAGRTTFTFDADGNQQVQREPSGNRTTYTWDYENRMTLVRLPDATRATMAYEPEGLRVKLQDSTGTRKFVWDEQNYLAETNATDDTQAVYTNEPRTYGRLISQRRSTTAHWYHFDAIGSTRQLTSSTAAVTDTRLFDAWGVQAASTGTTVFPFGYVGVDGYYTDIAGTRLYVRARYLRPANGAWLSRDRFLFRARQPAYVYVRSLPVRYNDPSGHVTRDFDPDPSKLVNMAWCGVKVGKEEDDQSFAATFHSRSYGDIGDDSIINDPAIAGKTAINSYHIVCVCQCCAPKDNHYRLACIVHSHLKIIINIQARRPIQATYGHEQRHVRNLLNGAESWAKEAAAAEQRVGCGAAEKCQDEKRFIETIGNNALNNWRLREEQHGLPHPIEGEGYLPLPDNNISYDNNFPVIPDCTKPGPDKPNPLSKDCCQI